MKMLIAALATVATLTVSAANAETLRGDAFITAMNGNTLTGKSAEGAEFDVYFLPGGAVTYQDKSGKKESGQWALDNEGDVCVTWLEPARKNARCFRVQMNGSNVTWEGKSGTEHGGLRGEVLPLSLNATAQ